MNKIGLALFALTLAASLMRPNPSAAEGAQAIAIAPGGARQGYATGSAVNYATRDAAVAAALAKCRGHADAPEATSHCRIVATYTRQCFGELIDPKAGTPGAGWAIAATEQEASRQALAKCRATAGASRRKFCKVQNSGYDMHD